MPYLLSAMGVGNGQHYPSLNRSKCCTKGICTECFLQMKSPNVTRPTQCPYCKMANYSVEYRGPKSMEEKGVEQVEEQKVIEAKIRMRQKELQDDNEREQRHHDDDQDYHPSPLPVLSLPALLPPPDPVQDSWRTAWESITHPPQGPLSSGLSERPVPVMEPDSLWVRGSQQTSVDDEPDRAHQQAMPALVSNILPSEVRHHDIVGLPRPQPPPGAQLTNGAPNFGFSQHDRDDEFDLDLEDIMVMEAIWLSIQEEGAQDRYRDDERRITAVPRSLSTLMTNFGLGSGGEMDLGAIMVPPPPSFLSLLPPPSVLDTQEQALGRRSSVTGGLACAIAALAERQVTGFDTSAQQPVSATLPCNPAVVSQREEVSETNQECHIVDEEEALETAFPSESFHRNNDGLPVSRKIGNRMVKDSASQDERGSLQTSSPMVDFSNSERERECASPIRDSGSTNVSEGLANWVSSTQWEYEGAASITKWSSDHSSEQVEVGTSFSSSSIPSASELPWEAADFPPDGRSGESSSSHHSMEAGGKSTVVPEGYEEQMMLAMALSLADAQARIH
ncbi:hypothetical protein CY35_09G013500 [Sphagnum magellanicum]|nr:hypothetical protein CY35_09G013500 [Sphagnum magellanicum]